MLIVIFKMDNDRKRHFVMTTYAKPQEDIFYEPSNSLEAEINRTQ